MANQMIISENDKRLYRSITLDNGLRAVLVSSVNCSDPHGDEDMDTECSTSDESDDDLDSLGSEGSDDEPGGPKEKMAAASLAINCGSFQDPQSMNGIAHYLEHMLFMGSEKYPKEEGYTEFISKHGGSDNAYTDAEMTVFYFDVNQLAFPEALDMFANFFVKPLLSEDGLDREVEAVESEFQLQQSNDEARAREVFARQAGEDHPMGKFTWGNLKSLKEMPKQRGLDIRKELIDFMNNYYSADAMTLCVQSKHSLDELETFVRESFSSVPKRRRLPIVYPEHLPFTDNPDFFKLFKVVPIKRSISVLFSWIVPPQRDHYREKNTDYLGYAIGHEGANSILDHLRNKQWAYDLVAGVEEDGYEDNKMCCIFSIYMNLTEEGAKNIAEVTRYVHQYIHMLRKKGPQQWLWQELQRIAEIDFRFEEECDAQSYVTSVSAAMQQFPEEHYLCGNELYYDYNPAHITKLMDLLTPDKCNIMYMHYEFQKDCDLFPLKEPWTGVAYKVESFPEDWSMLWSDDPEFQMKFSLPEPNRFISENFSIVKDSKFELEEFPVVVYEAPKSRLWFRKDEKFLVPKAHFSVHLISEKAFSDTTTAVCVDLMTEILAQLLAQTTNYAEMASLDFEINGFMSGLTLQFSGFNDKLPLLFEAVIDKLIDFDCSDDLFRNMSIELAKYYYNNVLNVKYADEVRNVIIQKDFYSLEARRGILEALSKKTMKETIRAICRSSYIEMYVHGNITNTVARSLLDGVQAKLKAEPTAKTVFRPYAVIEGETYVRFLSANPKDKKSRIINYYAYGPAHFYEDILLQFLTTLMEEKCFTELRTKQQLGYDTRCSMNNYRGVLGISVSISHSAAKFSASHVDERIEEYMDSMVEMVKNLTADEFNTTREAIIKIKSCVDLSMDDEHSRNWDQIVQFQNCFNKNSLEVNFLQDLKMDKFKKWCLKILAPEGGRRKLSVQLIGYGEAALNDCVGGEEILKAHLETCTDQKTDSTNISPIKLLLPKDTKGKTYVTEFESYLSKLRYHEPVNRDPRTPFVL